MNEEYLEEKAVQYALGTLPREEVAPFEAALRKDHTLQALVYEYQTVNEANARDVPELDLPFSLYSKIMTTLDSDEKHGDELVSFSSNAVPAKSGSVVGKLVAWGGWAVAACFVILMVMNNQTPVATPSSNSNEVGQLASADILLSELNRPGFEATPQAMASIRQRMDMEGRMIELAELAEAYWFSYDGTPRERELEEGEEESISRGFTLFDSKYRMGFIGVENLPDGTRERGYHVWAKTANSEAIRAGVLRSGDDSRGLFFFDLAEGEGSNKLDGSISFFVTEEVEERPEHPSDTIILSGI